ncbi:MAG: hypothetical protein Q9168_005218 [Polycauliona sp. 1 TL-2023]
MYFHSSLLMFVVGLLCQLSAAQENMAWIGTYQIMYCGQGEASNLAKLQVLLPQFEEKLQFVLADVKKGITSKAFRAYFKTNANMVYVESIFLQIQKGGPIPVPIPGAPSKLTRPTSPMILCKDPTVPGFDELSKFCKVGPAVCQPYSQTVVACDKFWKGNRLGLGDRPFPLRSDCPDVRHNQFYPDSRIVMYNQFGVFIHEFAHIYTRSFLSHGAEIYEPNAAVALSAEESVKNAQNFALYASSGYP